VIDWGLCELNIFCFVLFSKALRLSVLIHHIHRCIFYRYLCFSLYLSARPKA
jgi:hypothetical protein